MSFAKNSIDLIRKTESDGDTEKSSGLHNQHEPDAARVRGTVVNQSPIAAPPAVVGTLIPISLTDVAAAVRCQDLAHE